MGEDIYFPPIKQETYINVTPNRIFETLTTAEGWDAWFTCGASLDPHPGGHFRLRWVNFGARRWTMEEMGTVLEIEPNQRFVFQWHPGSTNTTVEFTLIGVGPGTRVELRESGYPRTEEDLAALLDCAAGWGEALTLLKFYLEHNIVYGEAPEENRSGS